jgi:hypothetical protein
MNQMIIKTDKIDFQALVSQDTKLSINFQLKIISQLQDTFTKEEEQWYIANLYVYLNYHPTSEFPINLENVFKMIGFAHKKNAMRTLENNFTMGEDYKITVKKVLLPIEINPKSKNLGGRPENIVMLNVDTFKNLCMMAKTNKGKEIRKYYVKLENMFNRIVNEERLEYEEKLIQEKEKVKELICKVDLLENKPETEGFYRKSGYIYICQETSRIGHYKIGLSIDPDTRESSLNVASSTCSLKMIKTYRVKDQRFTEMIIHSALQQFRIKKRNEWFYIKNDIEMKYVNNTIISCINDIEKYIFTDYNNFKIYQDQDQHQDQEHRPNHKNIETQTTQNIEIVKLGIELDNTLPLESFCVLKIK